MSTPADYKPATIKPLQRDGEGRTVVTITFDERFAVVWGMRAVEEAKRELVGLLVREVMEAMTSDRERLLKLTVESIADAIKDQVAEAVAARLTQ